MRSGLPNSSITRSSGRVGKPSGGRDSGVFGALMMSMLFSGSWCGGIGFGYGARARKLPGASSAPSSIWIMWIARQEWKPLECAAMPRIAYIATGRPTTLSCLRPHTSVHSIGSSTVSLNATCAISSAMRSMVSAGRPHSSATFSGA